MILPPFDPPTFDEMSRFWLSCTYRDVHRLILEVLHYRLTMTELVGSARAVEGAVSKVVSEEDAAAKAARRLRRMIEREQWRAGRITSSRERIAPFSDEWRLRKAAHHDFTAQPEDEAAGDATKLPRFQRLAWPELRNAWRESEYQKGQRFAFEQRVLLEVALARRIFRHLEKLGIQARGELAGQNVQSAAFAQMLMTLSCEITEFGE